MRAWLALATALLALLAAVPSEAGAREQSPKCYPRGADGIAAGTRARVFRVGTPGEVNVIYACDLLTGRRTRIAEGDRFSDHHLFSVRLAGRVVAFVHSSCERPLSAQIPCFVRVRTLDVQTRAARTSGELGGAGVVDLVVSPSGAAAWIEVGPGRPDERRVRALGANGQVAELDSGPAIEVQSLALAPDGRLYWRNGPLTRTYALDPPPPDDGREPTVPLMPAYNDPEPRGSRRCFPRKSATLAASTRIRVYRVTEPRESKFDDELFSYAACDLRTGHRTALGSDQSADAGLSVVRVAFAGGRAAVGVRECAKYASECWGTIHLLGGGKQQPAKIPSGELLFGLVLARTGEVAWIAGRSAPIRSTAVRSCDGTDCATLDTGSDLGWMSLARSEASDLYWMKGDEPRSAPMGTRP
jgi:hypothetical protein